MWFCQWVYLVLGGAYLWQARFLAQRLQQLDQQWYTQYYEVEKKLSVSETEKQSLLQQLQAAQSQAQHAQEELQVLWREHTVLKSTHEQRESHYQEQLALLSQARSSLTQEFENLAHKTFEEKGKNFVQHNQMGLEQLLKPFREQIKGFQKRVNEVHDAAQRGQASLYTEIKNIMDIGLKMSAEANNLTQALKGDSQQRGAWGEAQLRRTLEMSGCNDPLISCSGIITKEKYDEYRDDRRNQTLDS